MGFLNNKSFGAQGTIEYLVIISIVVVISLVIVGLFTGVFSDSSQQITDSSPKIGSSLVGGISVVDAVIDSDGDALIFLKNNSTDAITLTKFSAGAVDNNYNEQFVGFDLKGFRLSGLSDVCSCASGQKSVECELKIQHTTSTGVVDSVYRTVNFQCVSNVSARDEDLVVDAIDSVAPVISLSSPGSSVDSNVVDFVFNVTEANSISSCTLFVGSDSNDYEDISSGANTVRYTFANDAVLDWNVSCIDDSSNTGYSSSSELNVDSNAYQITTCLELQDMNLVLDGNFELMNDVNCSEIANFSPIGGEFVGGIMNCAGNTPFTGSFNGNNYTVSNLNVFKTGGDPAVSMVCSGLFGATNSAEIFDLTISDANITAINGGSYFKLGAAGFVGYDVNSTLSNLTLDNSLISSYSVASDPYTTAGGIVAYALQSTLSGLSVNDSNILGGSTVGGIVGTSDMSSLDNLSATLSNVVGGGSNAYASVGGIAGAISRTDLYYGVGTGDLISNATFSGSVDGPGFSGGIVGSCYGHNTGASVLNLINSGNVNAGACAGSLFGAADTHTDYYQAIDVVTSSSTGTITCDGGCYVDADSFTPYAGCWWDAGGGNVE